VTQFSFIFLLLNLSSKLVSLLIGKPPLNISFYYYYFKMEQSIDHKLREAFDVHELIIRDGKCKDSYLCVIVSDDFIPMKLLERQKKVNEILAVEIS